MLTTPVVVFNTGTGAPTVCGTAAVVTVTVVNVVSNTVAPFKVSTPAPVAGKMVPAVGLPEVPLPDAVSSLAIIAGAGTVIVTVAGSQFAGFNFSHKL